VQTSPFLPGDTKVVYSDGAGSGAAFIDAFASLSVVDLKVQDDLTVTDDLIVNGDIDLEGSIDVNGTANLDVVDIDGAVNMATTALVTGVLTTTATQVATGGITSGSDIISDTDSTDSLGSTGVRWLKGWFDSLTAGTLTVGSGSVTDSSGAISFGDENLTTTGIVTAAGTSVFTNLDISGDVDVDGIITGSGTADTLEGESTLTYTTGALSVTGSGDTSISLNTGNDSGDNSIINFGDTADAVVGFIHYDHDTNKMQFSANSVYAGTAYPQLEVGNSSNTTSTAILQVTNYGNIGVGRTPQYYGSNRYFDMLAGAGGAMVLQLIGNNGSQKMNIVASTTDTSIINETNTELKFGVNQTAYFTINTSGVMSGDFNDTSDRNLKENIESISASTDIVKQLRAVTFDWKEITHKNDKDEDIVVPARRNKAGFIAQEVQAISGLEHAVTGTPYVDGNQPTESLSLDTLPLLAHAIKTIQELEARNIGERIDG
jgi:hypothetical protein